MRRPSLVLSLVLVATVPASTALARPVTARSGVVERVVAVVDRDIILLSELERRAEPFRLRIEATIPESDGAKRVAAEQQMHVELLDRMIDERLEAAAAKRQSVTVSEAEIDAALKTIADGQKLSVPDLLEVARRNAGLGDKEYREEIGRQLLEGKLLQRIVHDRLEGFSSLTERERNERLEKERQTWIGELRRDAFVEKRL